MECWLIGFVVMIRLTYTQNSHTVRCLHIVLCLTILFGCRELQQYELSSPVVVTNYFEKKSQIVTNYFEKKSQLLAGETSTWPVSPAPGLLSRLVTQSPTGTSSPIAELLPLTESKIKKSAHAAAFMVAVPHLPAICASLLSTRLPAVYHAQHPPLLLRASAAVAGGSSIGAASALQ